MHICTLATLPDPHSPTNQIIIIDACKTGLGELPRQHRQKPGQYFVVASYKYKKYKFKDKPTIVSNNVLICTRKAVVLWFC